MIKIKITKLDKLFSEFIRKRAKGRCEWCKKPTPYEKLQTSHFFGRRKKSVRYDPDNAAALCFYDHQYLGENPHVHRDWFLVRLGEKGYKNLVLRENLTNRIDEVAISYWLKQEIKKLE